MLCILSGLISYIEYMVSFNGVTDIQYFIALEGDARAVNLGQSDFPSHSRHYAIYNVLERPISPRVNGENLFCKCFLGKFRFARSGGQRLAWEWLRSEGQIQSNYRKTTFRLVPSKNKFLSKEAISPLSVLTVKMTNLHPLILLKNTAWPLNVLFYGELTLAPYWYCGDNTAVWLNWTQRVMREKNRRGRMTVFFLNQMICKPKSNSPNYAIIARKVSN